MATAPGGGQAFPVTASHPKRAASRVGAGVVALFVLVACVSPSSPRTSTSPPLSGGTLRVGVVTSIQQQGCDAYVFCGGGLDDPQTPTTLQYELERCCLLRTLLSYNGRSTGDGGGVLRPDIAATLPQVSSDGLTWTFHLRRGLHYGPPLRSVEVSAQDFIRSIERALSPRPAWLPEGLSLAPYLDSYLGSYLNLSGAIIGAKAYGSGHAQHISGLQAPDDRTLVIHLTQASGNLGYLLAQPDTAPIPPVPSHPEWRFGAAQGHERLYSSYLVSTGPYMIEGAPLLDFSKAPQRQVPARGDAPASLTLVRNPSWHGASDSLRAAFPDRIELVPVPTDKVAQRLIGQGALDLALNSDSPPGLTTGSAVLSSPRDEVWFLNLNLAMPPLDDVHVRRAMNFAIARRPLVRFWNQAHLPAVSQTHIGLDNQENNLLLNFDPYHAAAGNLTAARREMARSHYDSNHDGRCNGSVCRGILLWANREQPEQVATARMVARDLKRIGLEVRAYTPAFQRFVAPYKDPSVHAQIVLSGWLKDTPSPSTYFAPLFAGPSLQVTGGYSDTLSQLASSPAQLKRWGYHVTQVPSVDGRTRQCLTLTFAAQTQCYAELDQYLTTQLVPWVPLISRVSSRFASSRVSRFNFDPSAQAPSPSLDRVVLRSHETFAPLPRRRHQAPPLPDGVYRFTLTRSDLLRFDPKLKPSTLRGHTGTTTAYLRGGWFEFVQRADHGIDYPITVGIYKGHGHRVTFVTQRPVENLSPTVKAKWSFDGQALHFKLLHCGNHASRRACRDIRATYEAQPWVKVADLS